MVNKLDEITLEYNRLIKEINLLKIQKDNLIEETNDFIKQEMRQLDIDKDLAKSYCDNLRRTTELEVEKIKQESKLLLDEAKKLKSEALKIQEENNNILNNIRLEKHQHEMIIKDIEKQTNEEKQLKDDNIALLNAIKSKESQLNDDKMQLLLLTEELRALQIKLDNDYIIFNEKQVKFEADKIEFNKTRLLFNKDMKDRDIKMNFKENELLNREREIVKKEDNINIMYKNALDRELSLKGYNEELSLYNAKLKKWDKALKLKEQKG